MNLFQTKRAPHLVRVTQIKEWVAQHLALPQSTIVLVGEQRCREPGCPPLETVIALFPEGGRSAHHKLHKALAEVTESDVRALAAAGDGASP